MIRFLRDDIYFCYGCGYFHHSNDDKKLDIPYHEMPASFAIHVMEVRQYLAQKRLRRRGKRRFNDL
jgi:hypothetical protein